MKKSKTISPSKTLIIIVFIISIINVIINHDKLPQSIYNENTKQIEGIITNCTDNNFTLTNKEKLLIKYKNFTCKTGIKVKIKGTLTRPEPNTIFNQFNYQKYLLSQKINYIVKIDKIKIINNTEPIQYKIKNNLEDYIKKYKSHNYLNAFILGNNKEIDENIMKSYQENGINHLFVISGMHITILSMILLFILNKISKNNKINLIIVIILLIFYLFLTNFTPSIIRATLMFIALTIKKQLKLKIETIYILILICALYLIYNPYMIYHIGFLYSFIITFFLILFQDLINKCKTYISKTFTISFIAFLASIPISINNFFSINIISPLINMIFVPLISLLIYPLSLVTLIIKPLDNILFIILELTEKLSFIFNNVNINITLKHINIVVILLYYLLIIYTLYKLKSKQIKGLIILILIIIIHHNINYFDNNNSLTMIDVGQGDSLLLKLAHNQGNILIDTGGQPSFNGEKPYDLAQNKIIPYLKSEGINKLDYLILTHGDFDHAGMSINLLKKFKVNNILLNSNNDNTTEKQIINYSKKHHIKYKKIRQDKIKIQKTILNFLNSQKSFNENDDSLIIYTKIKNQNILLMGDAEEERENYILNTYNLPKMDILKVGHHGSNTSTSLKLINKIRPNISLISAGNNNLYGHPHKQTIEKLKNSKVLITKIDGSIKINLNNKAIKTCAR